MNRILFKSSEIDENGIASFEDLRSDHVLTVLHGEVGQKLKTGVVNGLVGISEILSIDGRKITVRTMHTEYSIEPWIDVILAPPRPRAYKRLLPQLAAMGVRKIILVGAEKVEKSFWGATYLNDDVAETALLEGLMQSGTSIMPQIRKEKSFFHYMTRGRFDDEFAGQPLKIVAHPYGNGMGRTFDCPGDGSLPVLAIGPEGGWTDSEVLLLEDHGFSRYSLGSRILRTDTATVALLAQIELLLKSKGRAE